MPMTARMTNPAFAVEGAMDALQAVSKAVSRAELPIDRALVHLRASQINGCSVCVDMHAPRRARPARARSACSPSPPGARRRTSPTPSAPRSRSPRR